MARFPMKFQDEIPNGKLVFLAISSTGSADSTLGLSLHSPLDAVGLETHQSASSASSMEAFHIQPIGLLFAFTISRHFQNSVLKTEQNTPSTWALRIERTTFFVAVESTMLLRPL